jgi:hypothetical protein
MRLRSIQILFILAAVFLIVEGIISIVVFWGQPLLYQAARGVRIAIGVCLLLYQYYYIPTYQRR